ncbi:MAG: right-handed parallel beta-helix repeat-containing protein [Verrucomicrobiales bacterium]|nr:right-handed parallel beta-helix repeat-containing protein [Verrucomicrobiales bacterium]
MKKTAIILLLASVVSLSADLVAGAEGVKLPGARVSIEAIEYASIQDAIDALPKEGGEVVLPAGKFVIREPLVITGEDVSLRGVGTATHIYNANEDGKAALMIVPQGVFDRAAPGAKRKYRWRVQISDMRITGNEKSGHGIDAVWVNEIYLEGVTVSYHGGDGINMLYCLEDARLADSLITYNKGSGVYILGNHDTVVSGTQFEENTDALQFIDGFNLTFTSNIIDDHLRNGVVLDNSMGNTISANMIEQCEGIGVVLKNHTYATIVGANIFTANRKGGVVMEDVHGTSITGNTFTIMAKNAVSVNGKCRALTISGNTFADRSIGEGQFKGKVEDNVASGIVLSAASVLNITGNTFSNLSTKALIIEGKAARQVVFSNNLLINTAGGFDKLEQSKAEGNLVVKGAR